MVVERVTDNKAGVNLMYDQLLDAVNFTTTATTITA